MASLLRTAVRGPVSEQIITQMIQQTGIFFLVMVSPLLAAAALASLAGSVAQGLPIFGANATGLKWEKLNPINGLSRLKAKVSWTEWLKILVFVSVAAISIWTIMSDSWQQLVALPARDISSSNAVLRSVVTRLATYIVGAAMVIAVADYFLLGRWFDIGVLI
jgi:flagellar biosynthesis protein FlhB